MKMYMMIYDAAYDEDVTETLSTCCVAGFSKWNRVLGRGERSDPKMDNATWPGYNCSIMLALDETIEPSVFKALKALHEKMGKKGLKVFGWNLEKVI